MTKLRPPAALTASEALRAAGAALLEVRLDRAGRADGAIGTREARWGPAYRAVSGLGHGARRFSQEHDLPRAVRPSR